MNNDNFQEGFAEMDDEEQFNEELSPLLDFGDLSEDIEDALSKGQQISPSVKIIKKKDIETEIPNYDENSAEEFLKEDYESAKKTVFEPTYIHKNQDTDEPEEHQEVLIRNFRDFLVLPRISGARPMKGSRNIINKEQIQEGANVEISNKPPFGDVSSGESSVIVNRNLEGEIESLEVYCKDGEKIVIRFDFGDDSIPNIEQ